MQAKSGPAYRVETERLVVRCWSPRDAARFRAFLDESSEYLRPWIPWMKHEPLSLEATAQRLREHRANFDLDKTFRYAIFSADDKTLIGETGLYKRGDERAREIGYLLGRQFAGQGYALEASAAMVKIGFELDDLERIEIHCAPQNAPSAAVARRLGFTHEATLKRRIVDSADQRADSMIWVLFSEDYPRTAAARAKVAAFDCMARRIL